MRIRLFLLPSALVAVLAGCAAPGPADPGPVETTPPAPEGFSIAALVAQLPAIDGDVVVSVGDVEAAADLVGLERPAEPGDPLTDWMFATSGVGVGSAVSLPWPSSLGTRQIAMHGDFMDAVGFGIPQVDAFIEAAAPPTVFTLVEGRFDPSAVTAALGEPEDGVWAQPGEELMPSLDGDRSVDMLGRPVYLAGDGARLVLTLERRLADGFLAGVTGPPPVLEDVAAILDDEGAYAAFLSSDGVTVRAAGLVPDGAGGSAVIAVTIDPEATAPEVGATDASWSVVDVEERGAALLIRLDAGDAPPAVAWNLLQIRSPLLG